MSIIKSFSVGNGDMFYIKHGSSNFSIIDCNIDDDNEKTILDEIVSEKEGKVITRFISTHPDEDHLHGLKKLDDKIEILNFYCVKNEAIEEDETEDFKHYCGLRDGEHHYYVSKGCKRKWMNDNDENDGYNYGSSGINFLWPITTNDDYKEALKLAAEGKAFNNLSPIFTYSFQNSIEVMWMGDIEHDFLEKVKDEIDWPEIDVLFAPHHGRDSGKVPDDVLKKLNPQIIVIGEAPSKYLNYYPGYNTIKQNSAGDIVFECHSNSVDVYVSNSNYSYDTSFLSDATTKNSTFGTHLGSFTPKNS
ncbi:hypothetical protein [Ruminococcus sp.]|uniref:hypothetical protein n=1 Tax=Ruminococcus sp. TaxID=41978 RepID=UPI00388FFB49